MLQEARGRVRRQMKHSVRINFFNVGVPPLVFGALSNSVCGGKMDYDKEIFKRGTAKSIQKTWIEVFFILQAKK